MTIDIERLSVDADYWNAVAPEGATHLIDEHRFVKWIYGAEYEFSIYGQDKWSPAMNSYSLEDYANENIWQVLANPAAPEWEGLFQLLEMSVSISLTLNGMSGAAGCFWPR